MITPRRRKASPPQQIIPADELVRQYTYAGTLLRTSRKALGLTQQDISTRIGLALSAVQMIEEPPTESRYPKQRWPHIPNDEKLKAYARVVQVDYCDLWPPDPASPYAQLRLELARFDVGFISRAAAFLATLDPRMIQGVICQVALATSR